jgi:type I restriction-modification system DNA methylase subunit
MTAPTQPPPLEQSHRNHGLFSDHYLNETLRQRPDWQRLVEEAIPVKEQIKSIFERSKPTPSEKEAQTEEDWVRPVLRSLGHADFAVQPSLKTPDGTKEPDYIFYRDRAALDSNRGKTLDEDLLQAKAYAVGDAKRWDRPLDIPLKESEDPFTNKTPSYQISFYMQHSGMEWGLLTNGRLWRLYHKDSAYKLDRFYEVDLPELLASEDVGAFLYFYTFFRRAAFEDHSLGVTEILRESTDYARGVGDTLKGQVYEALRHLAQGFLDYPQNELTSDTQTLREIYDSSLIVLYRLLFVLYAESRDLLPVRESEMYRNTYSLHAIKHEVARGQALLPTSAKLWHDLRELFDIINQGSPPLDVATFDGGLFDPVRHPFLERYTVGDAHLQMAVDKLSRVDGQFVDYRDLAERHLGTIYEGLLEFHLEELSEPEEGWTVALLNDKGERKVTGSYYTPDYIVKYIVEETVGPVLQEAVEGAKTDDEKIEAVLGLNVLDPSMGSGHFLVEATEQIARFLVELNVSPGETDGEAELAYWKRRVAQSCVYGVDLNPLAVDLAKLSLWLATVAKGRPLSFLDHHLRTGNSLVGARLSDLQLGSDRKGRKKVSNDDETQLSMISDPAFQNSMSTAVGNMWLIEDSPADTVEEVKEQERIYETLREYLTRRYAKLADLATATYFGVKIDRSLWKPLADYATGHAPYAPPQFHKWLDEAQHTSSERRFFHWELEFPEVFFDRQGRPLGDEAGFDAVIGNPPYVRQQVLGQSKPYFAAAYPKTYHGVADLYVYFYEQGLRQLRRGGRMSYIVTNKWLRVGYGGPLRSYFASESAVEEIVDFGHAPIFPDADVFPCIVVLRKPKVGEDDANRGVRVVEFPREALGEVELEHYVEEHGHTIPRQRFGKTAWSLEPQPVVDLMEKIRQRGIALAEFTGVKPYRGVTTGLNEAFLIDTPTKERLVCEDPRSAEIIKPYLRGQDIKRWSPEWNGLWMIFARRSISVDAYPAIKQHLSRFRERLEPRPRHWSGGGWPGRKPGPYKWYEIQDTTEYWPLFERPKIIHTDITWRPQFAFADRPTYLVNSAYMWPTADMWVLAVVNSPLLWSYMWRNATHGKDEALRLIDSFTETLPIASPTEQIRAEAEPAVERLISLAKSSQEARRDMLDWLRTEFGVEKPGQKLEGFASLDADAFVEEVRKRRPKSAGRLTPVSLKDLRAGYAQMATPVREGQNDAAKLERRLSDLVNRAYDLTPREVGLLWTTAPPRTPRF